MKNSEKKSTHNKSAVSEWGRIRRREEFRKLLDKSDGTPTHRVPDWKGGPQNLRIIKVSIDLPKYRISNGRTMSFQQEYVEKHNLSDDFFSKGDDELTSVQNAQHEILKGMIRDDDLEKVFMNPKQIQTEAILLDENGFVVNGNRRLCCWRELIKKDSEKYSHFRFIEVAILEDCSEAEINRLEAKLQIEPDIRADYKWHTEAYMYEYQMKHFDMTDTQVANLYGKTTKDVNDQIAKRKLAMEYLKAQGKENMWSLVSESDFAFDSLLKSSKRLKSNPEKIMFKNLSYLFIEKPKEAGKRVYATIPEIQEYLSPIIADLKKHCSIEVETVDDGEENYFGGGDSDKELDVSRSLALVRKIGSSNEMKARARECMRDTIERESQKKNEKAKKDYLSNALRKGLNNIEDAANYGLRPESSKEGVDEQLAQIRKQVDVIDSWIKGKS